MFYFSSTVLFSCKTYTFFFLYITVLIKVYFTQHKNHHLKVSVSVFLVHFLCSTAITAFLIPATRTTPPQTPQALLCSPSLGFLILDLLF